MVAANETVLNATIVLVPIRSFDDAKSRLAESLDPLARRALMCAMAETVVAAAHELPVWVVTDDAEVTTWAQAAGAATLGVAVNGLNPAITVAAAAAAEAGAARMIIAHADLPYASDLRVVTGTGVAIAPDRHRDGSNVMSLPTNSGFRFAYGPGSFAKHRAEALRLGLEFNEIEAADLAYDVDSPADLPSYLCDQALDRSPIVPISPSTPIAPNAPIAPVSPNRPLTV